MKRSLSFVLFLSSPFAMNTFADPPKLASTTPQFWATGVSASQKTISLTFDQRLRSSLTDWIGGDVLSPASDLQTKYSPDHMSCSIDVHLEPGHVYICALNGRGLPGVGFQNEKGLSLPPTFLVFQTAGPVAGENAPPHVVRSVPANGSPQIDPARTPAIVITFDQRMAIKKHGMHLLENGKPADISKIAFAYSADGRTFSIPYSLKPGTQYRLELNSTSDIGFSRANWIPLWPVQISFSTQ
ncbi:MAG TPA: Ig-like domain-containing protein [Pyrinomonadaceae bacterium]|nr:Ig-like domain-containing protein [Pyrinomonadaceae bacterium]